MPNLLDSEDLLDSDILLDGGGGHTFQCPTNLDVGPINPDTEGMERKLMGYYKPHPRGRNVWVLPDGTFTEVQPWPLVSVEEAHQGVLPIGTVALVPTYKDVYYGGHVYQLSDQEVDALTAAGYGPYIT